MAYDPVVSTESMPDIEDIWAQFEKASTALTNKYPNMTFEDGVAKALAWVLGETPDEPLINYDDEGDDG